MIRVLVVDDSGFMRMALRRIIEADGDLKVVGEASEATAALELAGRLRPDVVTMDLEMPGLDGIEATRRLAALPDPPAVVMVSHHTRDGSANALAALGAGAADVLWKGSSLGSLDLAQIDRDLRGRLRHWAAQRTAVARAAPPLHVAPALTPATAPSTNQPSPAVPPTASPARRPASGADVVLIAASTGGPEALEALLGAAGTLAVPLVIAQHMPPDLGPDLARHLGARSGLSVVLGTHGMPLAAGLIAVIPGGTDGHLARAPGGGLALRLGKGEGVVHPSADTLFRSAALVARGAVGIVLTGMGRDGTAGAAALRERGMAVLVQSPESCVVAGMPGAVIEAGLATGTGTPAALGARLPGLTSPRPQGRILGGAA